LIPDCHVFVRLPGLGQVKTRLAATRGDEFALALYGAFLEDLLPLTLESNIRTIFRVDGGLEEFRRRIGRPRAILAEQGGGDLGERLSRAFAESETGAAEASVAIGSDSPLLGVEEIRNSAAILVDGAAEAILKPTMDGGYSLVGFRRGCFHPSFFEGIDWSTEKVFEQTRDLIVKAGLSCQVLELGYDVDVDADLARLSEDLAREPGRAPATARVLDERGFFRRDL